MSTSLPLDDSSVEFLHELGSSMASADALHEVLARVVDFASALVKCDSCLIYVLEDEQLLLRASKNPHPDVVDRLKLSVGEGITGWVAEHHEPVAVSKNASQDPRFQFFHELPEDTYEAFLSVPLMSRGRVVGVINLQHRRPHVHNQREIRLISTAGFLVGAEIEMARLESENTNLSQQLETRKIVERAKGILQRDLSLDEEQAYLALQRQSRQTRKSMRQVAEAVVLTDELRRNSRAIQRISSQRNCGSGHQVRWPLPPQFLLGWLRVGDRPQSCRFCNWRRQLRPSKLQRQAVVFQSQLTDD